MDWVYKNVVYGKSNVFWLIFVIFESKKTELKLHEDFLCLRRPFDDSEDDF